MSLFDILAILAAAGFVVFLVSVTLGVRVAPRHLWVLPAALSAAFLAFSAVAVAVEGPTGFWPEHTRSLWGNQIWFDLLLAAGTAAAFLAPEARRLGMPVAPWLALVVCTGSVGLLAMASRVLYLRARAGG